MSDLEKKSKPRNYLAHREQRRLLMLVLGFGLVVVIMMQVRDSKTVAFLSMFFDPPAQSEVQATGEDGEPIDPREYLQSKRRKSEIPGTFIMPAPLDDTIDESGNYFTGVRPGYFTAIKDDLPLRGGEEYHPWYHLLEVLQDADEESLRKASTGRATWAQLFRQSDQYRGELVTIIGTVRRAHYIKSRKNHIDIKGYNRLWVFPEDNPGEPIVVYSLYLPEGFPMGMEIAEEATITGFFFKRWVHEAANDVSVSPLILSRTIDWKKRPPKPVVSTAFKPTDLIIAIVGALIICAFVIFRVYRQTQMGRKK
jgi:hypothetical protein